MYVRRSQWYVCDLVCNDCFPPLEIVHSFIYSFSRHEHGLALQAPQRGCEAVAVLTDTDFEKRRKFS